MTAGDILIVDDEADIRMLINGILEDEGYATREAGSSDEAYREIGASLPRLLILDIWLKNSAEDGMEILRKVKELHPHLPVVMISGHGNIETAVSAIKVGAYDFIEKPFKTDRLLLLVQRALEAASLRQENETLRRKVEGPSEFVGNSPVMASLKQALERVAVTNSRVLLTGEPGTGKDLAARALHRMSQRVGGPFVVLNCAVMRPESFEIELFGSMTGDDGARTGLLERAHGGTLFLDEVADMPLETQAKIVRVLQEQKFQRIGDAEPIETDARIIASSNRDLEQLIREGRFRQDLYYRLNVVHIEMPPLRSHLSDISTLCAHFLDTFSQQSGIARREFLPAAMAALQAHDWPGNVRQLRNVVESIMIMYGGQNAKEGIGAGQLPAEIRGILNENEDDGSGAASGLMEVISLPLREARETFESRYLASQIRRFDGNISRTAQFVGMERSALHRKLKQLGISEPTKQNDKEEKSA